MAKAFSVLSWNVEHFGAMDKSKKKPKKPIEPIIQKIAEQNADVIGIYEVVGSQIYHAITDAMPNYHFHITEGPQSQEILIGVKKNFSSFFTQKVEFKSGNSLLRPGALLSLKIDGISYSMLFLHLKSLTTPRGFGLRDDMVERAIKFRKVLTKASGSHDKSNFIFLGDLNTMGMNLTYQSKDISAFEELSRLGKRVARVQMRVLDKSGPTFWPGTNSSYDPGNLDHVVAANHLQFKSFGGNPIDLRGWPQEMSDAKRDEWAKNFSDHAILYFEVQKSFHEH